MIVAGNWKMNLNPSSAQNLMSKLKEYSLQKVTSKHDIILLLPAYYFQMAGDVFQKTPLKWGGQNCFSKNSGSFTGEISPQVMSEMGATHCLVGHSERRTLFHETPSMIEEKFHAILENNMTPILCVGETLKQRENKEIQEVLESQLKPFQNSPSFIVAYEPLWAIGASKPAQTSQVQEALNIIRQILNKKQPVLYGGSVTPSSAKPFTSLSIDGFLVGRSSLDFSEFTSIYENIH